jgi:WD40 repeat protein
MRRAQIAAILGMLAAGPLCAPSHARSQAAKARRVVKIPAHSSASKEIASLKRLVQDLQTQVNVLQKLVTRLGGWYDLLNQEFEIEAQVRAREKQRADDQKLALKRVSEISDEELTSIAQFSPSEQSFAAIAGDGGIKVLDTTARLLRLLKREGEQATSIAYSPDGRRLMAGTRSGKVLVWELSTGESRVVFEKPGAPAARVAWLAGSDRGVMGTSVDYSERKQAPAGFVFSLSTGEELWTFSSFVRDDFQTLAASPDGKWIGVLDIPDQDRGAFLLDAGLGSRAAALVHPQHQSGPLSVAIAPDGNTVAVGYAPYDVALWDARRKEAIRLLKGHENWVVSLAFSPDGRMLISGAGDSTARVWSVQTGAEIGRIRFPGSSNYVHSVAFSPDGKRILAAAGEGKVRVVIAETPGGRP